MNLEQLKYPIGQFEAPEEITPERVELWIDELAHFPGQLRAAVERLSEEQLDTPYRPDGWTVRQVVHHVADSHLNSLVRFKWTLTEDHPTIKPYHEARWAELHDYTAVPVASTLDFLDLLHERWVILLRSLNETALQCEFDHPETGVVRLDYNIGLYAWHSRHHLAHITSLTKREGW